MINVEELWFLNIGMVFSLSIIASRGIISSGRKSLVPLNNLGFIILMVIVCF